jgi:hypothetical protein
MHFPSFFLSALFMVLTAYTAPKVLAAIAPSVLESAAFDLLRGDQLPPEATSSDESPVSFL